MRIRNLLQLRIDPTTVWAAWISYTSCGNVLQLFHHWFDETRQRFFQLLLLGQRSQSDLTHLDVMGKLRNLHSDNLLRS